METAQELDTAGVWNDDTTHKVSLAAAEALKEATHTRSTVRWMAVVIALQLLVLCGMGYGALVLKHQVETIREAGVAQHEAASQQIAAIETQTKELAHQVQGLRSLLASDTAEDVIFLKIMVLKPRVDPELARTIAASIHHHARQYGRDPDLVLAIMAVESAFNPEAVSRVGAEGLMQVMPHWKEVLAIKGDLKDVDVSVKYGLQILAFYEQMYKDLEMALTAYNRGPGPVDRALMKGKSSDNGYAPRVLAVYERLKGLRAGATAKGERL